MIKKVIMIKDLPSNIFEDVTFTIKEGVNIDIDKQYKSFQSDTILTEAEAIIREYIDKYENVEIKKETILNKILSLIKKE